MDGARTFGPYRLAASAYLRPVAARLFWRLWWVLAVPLALVCYSVAASDWRWAVVAFMALLIIYPMVMSLAVMRYAASERVLRRASAVSARMDTDGSVTLYDADSHIIESLPPAQYVTPSHGRLLMQYSAAPDDILLLPD